MPLNFITDSAEGRSVDSPDRNAPHAIPIAIGGSATALPRVVVDRCPGNLEPRVHQMLGPERKAKSGPDFPAVTSSPLAFRATEGSGEREQGPRPRLAVAQRCEPQPVRAEPVDLVGAPDEKSAAKQALAANLEGMIEGMLRTTQFATAAATKTRGWAQQIGEAAALDASTDGTAFTANSLIADLAQARPVVQDEASPSSGPRRRWWIDAVLALACILSVASAGYLTFAP